jgi:outer membrane protein assembly factor BamB
MKLNHACPIFFLILVTVFCYSGVLNGNEGATQKTEAKATGSQGGVDWPKFLGPTGDGKSSEKNILTDWSDGKLKLLWKIETGEGYAMGSVAKGRFYHFGRVKERANLRCLDAATGAQQWEFTYDSDYQDLYGYDSGPRTSPIIDDGLVYIYGVEGMLHCLDALSGKVVWKQNLNERFGVIQNFFGVASTPVIYEDLILVMVGGSPQESQKVPPGALGQVKPNQAGICAFNKKTGELTYSCVDDLASYCSLKLAMLEGEPVLLAWMRGSLFGMTPRSGKIKFEFPWRARILESVNASMPVVHNGQVLISECYGKGSVLLDPAKLKSVAGKIKPAVVWSDDQKRAKAMAAHWNTPIVIGDSMYGCSGRHSAQAELKCVDWQTGDVNWTQRGLARSSLTYVDGHFVVLGEQGRLLLIKADSNEFSPVTEYTPGVGANGVRFRSPCWAAPIIANGMLYVRGKDQLVCFQLVESAQK